MELSKTGLSILIFVFITISPLYSHDYIILPKLESGNNLSEVYQSSLFTSTYKPFTFSSYLITNYDNHLGYGFIVALSYEPYGTLSVTFAEKDVDQVYVLPYTVFHYPHKESAFNISYQKRISIVNLQIGLNISDPVHLKALEFNGQILPSLNLGIQLEPSQYIMIEAGVTNIFKKSSNLVNDYSEDFFAATSFMLLDELALKISLHKFNHKRINANFIARYYFTKDIYAGLNFSVDPAVLSISGGINESFGAIKIIAGLKTKNKEFFSYISYTFLYGPDLKRNKGIINKADNSSDSKQTTSHLININTATESQLMMLPNIGSKKAKKIIRYRQENGPFYYKEEFMAVSGIGIKTYNKLKDLITVGKLDPKNRLGNIRRWTMKEFVELGFSPALALRLVLFIRDKESFSNLEDLLEVEGFDNKKLQILKHKLKEYGWQESKQQ